MTIKIDGNRAPGDAEATRKAGTAAMPDRSSAGRSTGGRVATTGDRVEVSKDGQLMTSALKAAAEAPSIRHDVVERMRKLLDAGELGADTDKVADALIDRLLGR
jgi:flagellar biosynthesis anti-sigma factor FlgM